MPIGHFRNYERFANLYRDPDVALDRTHSHYQKTRAMNEIEQELLRKRGEAKSQGRQASRARSCRPPATPHRRQT